MEVSVKVDGSEEVGREAAWTYGALAVSKGAHLALTAVGDRGAVLARGDGGANLGPATA